MQSFPKISVIIAVRNAKDTLERAIKSLLAQDYPNIELLVLDAASTDGTLEIIKRYEPRITFWRSHADGGTTAAYNEGIARASGDLIGILNADDWYEPGIFHKVAEAFAAHPEADIVTCEARVVMKDDKSGNYIETSYFSGKSLEIVPTATPMPNARFFRKSVFTRVGDFMTKNQDGQRFIASDLEFLLRLSLHPLKNHILPTLGYSYLQHPGSLTFGNNPERMRQMYDERVYIAEMYLENPHFPAQYQGRLKRWHRRGTTRKARRLLGQRRWQEALEVTQKGLRISGIAWVLDFIRIIVLMRA